MYNGSNYYSILEHPELIVKAKPILCYIQAALDEIKDITGKVWKPFFSMSDII